MQKCGSQATYALLWTSMVWGRGMPGAYTVYSEEYVIGKCVHV